MATLLYLWNTNLTMNFESLAWTRSQLLNVGCSIWHLYPQIFAYSHVIRRLYVRKDLSGIVIFENWTLVSFFL